MKDNLSNIPAELRHQNRWIVWKRKGEKKEPYNPRKFSQHADINKPETWADFAFAKRLVGAGKVDGLGYAFKRDERYVVTDLDHSMTDGKPSSDAQEIVKRMDSYTEVSQSGEGLHIICRGEKPTRKAKKGDVEIYDNHFIYLTGNIWEDRKVIEDRQEALDWLCQETFDDEEDAPAEPVSDLVLDPDATPPTDKLDVLLKNRDFARTWKHKREDLKSLSEYDLSLTGFAYRAGWSDQEMTDLVIAFRRQYGTHDDLMKTLRQDYIKRTSAKVKGNADALNSLPFNVVKLLQYGTEDSEYELVLDDGRRINMGSTEALLSPRRAEASLYDKHIILPPKALKQWKNITTALLSLVEMVETVTRADSARGWMDDYINARIVLPRIDKESDINIVFGGGLNSIADDKRGRIYLRLSDITRYVRVHTGLGGVSQKTVARDLTKLKFTKRKVRIEEEGRDRQISLWVSEPGFISADEGGGEE